MDRKQILSSFKMPIWALTLRQPVASAVMTGIKTYETRNFHPGAVTEYALHAGQRDLIAFQQIMIRDFPDWPDLPKLPHAAILGVVRITETFDTDYDYMPDIPKMDQFLGWWDQRYAWKLEIVAKFDTPIPARGMPGFWKWSVNDDATG